MLIYSFEPTNKANLPFYLSIEETGNLVLFNSLSETLWNTKTSLTNAKLVMQNDGNLVVVDGNNQVYWASNTNTNENSLMIIYISNTNILPS